MKLSRRELVGGMAAGAFGVVAGAAQAPVAVDLNDAARASNKRISDALAKFEIPIATEPAFQFKA